MDPKHLHSIYLNGDINDVEHLPDRLWWNIRSHILIYPDAQHKFWTLEAGREFIRSEFDSEALATFDALVPLAYKSDFLRYAVLYRMGGLYSDMSVQMLCRPEIYEENVELFVLRDYPNRAPWIVSSSFMICKGNQDIFARMLSMIAEHVRNREYGVNPLCPTGPNLFGRMLAAYGDLSRISSGEAFGLNRSEPNQLAYRSPNGQFFALNFKLGRGLSSLGASQSHDYNVSWRRRKIYESVPGFRKESLWTRLKNRF